ncbi:hypothetical protein [Polaromonas sp. YR568]|jgi:hypothetical protein|uniref:hypothetical protein n=1 Tax=Polaromonas sp. YR568 TaxID=1855301 RepID=UPI00398C2328
MSTTTLSQSPETAQLSDGRHDFNFITGRWLVGNTRLKKRLAGCTDWERFEAVQDGALLLDGLGNMNDLVADGNRCIGMALRFFSPQTRLWSIYWVSHSDGLMQPPVVGAFANGTGRFEGNDTHEGRPVRVRFTWSGITPRSARWEQAFSEDGGRNWETNWVMELTRPAYSAA